MLSIEKLTSETLKHEELHRCAANEATITSEKYF